MLSEEMVAADRSERSVMVFAIEALAIGNQEHSYQDSCGGVPECCFLQSCCCGPS